MADDEGLYDDLDDALIIQPQEKELEKQRIDEQAKLATEKKLNDEVNRLQAQISELTAKNQNLEANIKFLLETSKEEIKRKDLALNNWQRRWDDQMFRKKKSVRSVLTQTDFQPEHRSVDRGQERRRSSHRSPEKNRRHDDKGSSSERDQKYRKSYKGSSTEQEQKYRGSYREEPPRRHSIDQSRGNDRTRDSRNCTKRSRSKSPPRRVDEKRRKLEDQRPSHKELRTAPDLRQTLLKKQANRSSPRKQKVQTAVKPEPQPKVTSPRKRKPAQNQIEAPTKALSIKSSDSDVEMVSVVNSKVPSRIVLKNEKVPEKSARKEIPQAVTRTAELAVSVAEEKKLEAEKVIQNEDTSSFHSADDGSKSPKFNELEKEILAAEHILENESVSIPVSRNLEKASSQESTEKMLTEPEENPGTEVATIIVTPTIAEPSSASTTAEPSSANVVEKAQKISPVKQDTTKSEPNAHKRSAAKQESSKAEAETIKESTISEVVHKISPAMLKCSPTKTRASPSVPEIVDHEPPEIEKPPPVEKSLQEPHPTLNGTLDSSGASKENSLNKSQHKKKRPHRTYEKEVQEDGTVVIVITSRSKKKKKKKDESNA